MGLGLRDDGLGYGFRFGIEGLGFKCFGRF